MGLATVGEGVETKEQAELLTELGCDHLQGFYYGKPETKEKLISEVNPAIELFDDDSQKGVPADMSISKKVG